MYRKQFAEVPSTDDCLAILQRPESRLRVTNAANRQQPALDYQSVGLGGGVGRGLGVA